MSDQSENFTRQSAAFEKIWLESMSRLMQAAFNFRPGSAPPELLRQIRDGILKALGESWNEFLRSPEFQQGMKQWMDRAIAFRRMTNDFMAKARKEMQAPSRDDLDAVILAVRQMETRILDRVEDLARQFNEVSQRSGTVRERTTAPQAATSKHGRTANSPRRRARGKKGKTP